MARARAKKSSIVIKIVLIAMAAYLLYVFIGLQIRINEKKAQAKGYETQIADITAENKRLKGILDADIDKEYIEKVARDMGYVGSDEKVYESITD